VTGPIIKRNFTLSAPDRIEVTVQGTSSDSSDINTGHKVKRRLELMRARLERFLCAQGLL